MKDPDKWKREGKKNVQVQIDEHIYNDFDRLCKKYGVSKSEILRRAIVDFIRGEKL